MSTIDSGFFYDLIWSVFYDDKIRIVSTYDAKAAEELLEILMQRKVEKGDIKSSYIKAVPVDEVF